MKHLVKQPCALAVLVPVDLFAVQWILGRYRPHEPEHVPVVRLERHHVERLDAEPGESKDGEVELGRLAE